jgi:hypothetical protein
MGVKATLYYVPGTTNIIPGVQSPFGLYVTPEQGWDFTHNIFALNPNGSPTSIVTSYDVVQINYPATIVGMYHSIEVGVESLKHEIGTTPGPFVLAGISGGAMVISKVYDEIRSGSMQDRHADFLGGISISNPMRETNRNFPGSKNPRSGSHGMMPADDRLVGTEDIWWEVAQPTDITAVESDDAFGEMMAAIAAWLMHDWNGVLESLKASVASALGGLFNIDDLQTNVTELYNAIAYGIQGQVAYRTYQPIQGDSRTLFPILFEHLTSLVSGLPDLYQPTEYDTTEITGKALEPGQFLLNGFLFGAKTNFRVETFDIGGYDVNVQDFQASISDEIRFGQDSLKPLPIQITINAFVNKLLPNVTALSPIIGTADFSMDPTAGEFAQAWRNEETRKTWGQLLPLYFCREDNSVVQIYGRPGKLAVSKRPINGVYHKIVAEFRRSDTFAYSNFEWFVNARPLEIVTVARLDALGMGDAPTWVTFLIIGPADHPIIQFGDQTIDLDVNIELGEAVEICSYPWERRVIQLPDGINYSSRLNSPYLDQIKFMPDSGRELSWNATNVNQSVESVDFTQYSLGTLPSDDWLVDYDPYGATGTIAIQDNSILSQRLCGWNIVGTDSKLGIARYKTPTLTDYQLVGQTIAFPASPLGIINLPFFGSNPPAFMNLPGNRILGRMTEDMKEYVYCETNYWWAWFGYHRNGTDYVLSPRYYIPEIILMLKDIFEELFAGEVPSVDWKYDVEFGSGEDVRSYALRVNDVVLARFTEKVGLSVYDKYHRWTGFGMKATSFLTTQDYPGMLSEWHMRDNPPPEIAKQLNVSQLIMTWRDSWNVIDGKERLWPLSLNP